MLGQKTKQLGLNKGCKHCLINLLQLTVNYCYWLTIFLNKSDALSMEEGTETDCLLGELGFGLPMALIPESETLAKDVSK